MINPRELLQTVIIPTLDYVGIGGQVQTLQVLGTMLTESGLSHLVQTAPGPALGLPQMEPATARDMWTNYIRYRPDIRDKMNDLLGKWPDGSVSPIIGNLYYAAAMCRLRYVRVPAPHPELDLEKMAAYWKQWYNTPQGAGRVEDFMTRAAVIVDPSLLEAV